LLHRSWPASSLRNRTLHDLRVVVKRDWRFAMSQTGGFLSTTLELWVAGFVLSGGATSLFVAAHRLGHLLVVPYLALQVIFSPAVARLAAKDEHGHLEPLVRTAASVATAAGSILWLPMVVAPGLILSVIFGDGFATAAPALVLLASAYLLNSSSGPSMVTLSMSHHEGDVAMITWCVMVPRVVSGALCAWAWGVTGLAASTAAMAVLTYVLGWWAVRKRVGISTHVTLRPSLSLLRRISG
jgi:O-antigen/teichoic acid export membrane protein